ncbi:restriction endonuclease subunit S [Catenibacterium mitsuokai]|uniref:restriction endonuclease subunit S n=1 Tax=Catenibacterium mitsuokai TaxID=100886 RepID=UPI00319E9535
MEYVKLEEICTIVSGGTPSRSKPNYWNNGNIPWIKIKDMKSKYIDSAEEFITEEGLNNSSTKMLKRGTILYSIFATLGEVGILKIDACTNQAIAGLSLKEDSNILKEYLYYYLKSKKKDVNNLGRGVAQNNINLSLLRKFKIPVIPLCQQKKIIEVLDNVSSTINNYERELALLDELVKARFVEMFGDPVTNDMLWNTDVLKDICTKIGSGSTPRGGKESYIDEGISLIRSMNVHNAYFEYKDLAHITLDQAEKLNNVVVEHDDLLFNITGASVARCCVVPSDVLPARVNQHVCILRCREKINPIFLQGLLVNENYQGKLLQIAKSGATREAINKQQLESLEIMIPPLELQNQFASFVQEIDKSRSRIQKSLEASQELFDSLMQEYFG